jgi:hypothetical protein
VWSNYSDPPNDQASIGCVGLVHRANADFEYYELPVVVVIGVRT